MASYSKISAGVIWAAIDKFGIVFLQFVINIILARLLTPQDFGLVGMIMIFVVVAQMLVDGGFGSALIQKQNTTSTDYSTIFYWNFLFSVLLYLIIYVSSNSIASFFDMPLLAKLLRLLGVIVIINSFGLVQKTKLRKQLEFKKIAITDIISYIIASCVTILIAHKGYGVWSLVWMYVINAIVSSTLFWCLSNWHPTFKFSIESLKSLFSYGGFMLIAEIMQNICTHIQGVIIGHNFSAKETGLYTQAKKMDEVASLTIPAIMCQVLFPLLSKHQNDTSRLISILKISQQSAAFVIFPLMILLIIVAEPLLLMLYGDQWIEAVPYFQILCIGGLFSALYNFGYYAVAAIGKSKALFYWGCYKWGMLIVLLLIGASISIDAVLWAMVLSNLNIFITNALLVQHYIKYKLVEQIKDVLSVLILSTLCGIAFHYIFVHFKINWIIVSVSFIVMYLILGHVFKLSSISAIRSFVFSFVNKK